MDTMHDLADIMRAGRALAGMSQAELAAASGLSRQIIARMENHGDNITVGALSCVRQALEKAGVVFIPSTPTRGPGVAASRRRG
jgi:transcriptional regulator with XRE-family HTH domain